MIALFSYTRVSNKQGISAEQRVKISNEQGVSAEQAVSGLR